MKVQKKRKTHWILLFVFQLSNRIFRFTDLLEFADDTLHCKHVIVSFDKTRSDRASLVKTFMFLGFHVLSPDNILQTNHETNPDQLYMVYLIDSDG